MPNNPELPSPTPQSEQLQPSTEGRVLVETGFDDNSDRFVHVKNLIALFSQKLMRFLKNTHEDALTNWIIGDPAEKEPLQVGPLEHTEGTYPPHVIALRDFINFLNTVSENLDTLNQLLKQSRNGIAGIVILNYWEFLTSPGWLSETHQKYKKIQQLRASYEKLQKSIGAIKKLPIKNGIIDGALYLYDQLSKYLQGDESEHLIKVMRVMKDALSSSELLQLKQNEDSTNELLHARLPIKARLETYYWKILLATDETQRRNALEDAQKLHLTTDNERAIFSKIDDFVKSPAWDIQRLTFLKDAQQLPMPQDGLLTSQKCWLYSMQLKSIISQVMAVTPEFMTEDNDAGNMLRMIGTLKRLPTDMINKIDHKWFMQVMTWLHANYDELSKDPDLKTLTAIVESEYNIHTNFLADLDELETELGLKFGLLTRDIPKKIVELKPEWMALSGKRGPTEKSLRAQAEIWEKYLQQQTLFRAKERVARLARKKHLLVEKKQVIRSLLEDACLKKLSHIYTLNFQEAQTLKNKLIEIAEKIPSLSSLGKYIEKKLQEIETQIKTAQKTYNLGKIRNSLWSITYGYGTQLNATVNEQREINAAIEATEKEIEASIMREVERLESISSDTYKKNLTKSGLEETIKKLEKEQKDLLNDIKTLHEKIRENFLEDQRAQKANESDIARFKKLKEKYEVKKAELARLSEQLNPIEMEKKFADARLADHIQQNSDALAEIASILEENSNTLSEPSPLETQSAMKEQGSIEQLLKIVDSAKMFLAQHISDGQLYQEETLSQEKALFDIRTCDKNWIRELKQAHNLLVQTKDVLSAYQNNLTNRLQLVNSLSKLLTRLGDILQAINTLEPHLQQNWFKPLQQLFSSAQKLSLVSGEPAPQEPREANSTMPSADARETQLSLRQKIEQDFEELEVELPSNLPARDELDSDLTALFSMINALLSTDSLASLSAKGLELYNSPEFKKLMDLISKISTVAGSDFVYEKLSSYRASLTKQLFRAIQHVLTEEIFFGYRPGVLTKDLYQMAEVLADYGLIDIPTLYASQLSDLYATPKDLKTDLQKIDSDIKNHFATYINTLLTLYATQQTKKWNAKQKNLLEEIKDIDRKVVEIKRQNTHSRISTAGKDLDAKQQSLELKKAQINRHIIAKNREITFLEGYAKATNDEGRATLSKKYAAQEEVRTKLNGIARQLTIVKWDIYYYEFEKFNTHIEKINQLIGLLETYIEQLATGKELATLKASARKINQENQQLPPEMQHLFTLALQTIEKDLELLTSTTSAAVDTSRNVQLRMQSTPAPHNKDAANPIIQPIPELHQALMAYAHDEARRLDVKDDWYRRNIIEHLEIFTEMWSSVKTRNQQVVQRRNEILNALQADNAPDYRFLSHPADVKIVYLLTVSGEHGLDLHSRILSKNGMQRANAQFDPQLNTLAIKSEDQPIFMSDITSAINWYQHNRNKHALFNGKGDFVLTETNINYLNDIAKKYTQDPNLKKEKKLRAIYNALIKKDYKALLAAVSMRTGTTGLISSDAMTKGGFKDPSDETPSSSNDHKH